MRRYFERGFWILLGIGIGVSIMWRMLTQLRTELAVLRNAAAEEDTFFRDGLARLADDQAELEADWAQKSPAFRQKFYERRIDHAIEEALNDENDE
jgi:predicted ferric reductase